MKRTFKTSVLAFVSGKANNFGFGRFGRLALFSIGDIRLEN